MEKETLETMRSRLVREFLDVLIMNKMRNTKMTGYDGIRYALKKFDMLISSGTMYSTFYSLERDGLIEGKDEGNRRVYSLTPKGEETLEAIHNSNKMIQNYVARILYPNEVG